MEQQKATSKKPFWRPILMVVLWPAFMAAIVATGVFFSVVDPTGIDIFEHHLELDPLGAYTVGFLGFWSLGILSSTLTALLMRNTH